MINKILILSSFLNIKRTPSWNCESQFLFCIMSFHTSYFDKKTSKVNQLKVNGYTNYDCIIFL